MKVTEQGIRYNKMLDTNSNEFKLLNIREKIEILREKGSRKELTIEDMKLVIQYLREDRMQLVSKSKEKKTKDKVDAAIQGNQLLADLKSDLGI